MIWIWVSLACLITYFQLLNKKISWYHYVWMLLPIDMYGISISDVTIKPYMLFSLIILLTILGSFKSNLNVRFNVRLIISLLGLFSIFFSVDIFNGAGFPAFKQHFMLIIIILCALLYVSLLTRDDDLLQIRQVMIATALGYGIVFFIAVQMNAQGINVGGLSTFDRTSEGVILKFADITEGRLRGFFIDPNVVITGFIVAIAIAIYSLPNERRVATRIYYLFTIVVCTIDLYYTESRTALIILILITLLSIYTYFKKSQLKIISNIIFILLIISIFTILFTSINSDFVFIDKLLAQYENRSSLNDEYGRMTIWKNAWHVLMNNNMFLGIGQGQIPHYTYRDSHNTWLEWIVGNGILVGGLVVFMFVSVPLIFYQKCQKINKFEKEYYPICLGFLFGFIGIIISLFTVSNITNSYLIFMTFLLISIRIPSVDKK